jgi:MIP family channel proteins
MEAINNLLAKMNVNIHWNEKEPDTNKFIRACIGEFIALMFFVVLACGGAMTTLHADTPNMMEIAASFGFAIMVIAQFIGPLSGAHINCAVSFALWLGGRISGKRMVCYTAAQMAGAFAGGIILLIIFGTNYEGGTTFASNSWNTNVFNGGQVFVAEAFGTAILVFNVFATIDHPVEGGGALGVFPIAMSVMVAHLFLVPIDGCSINPTRSFGTYMIASFAGATGDFHRQQYMFWFGPLFGAAVATIIYGEDEDRTVCMFSGTGSHLLTLLRVHPSQSTPR